jgi:predicted nucleic acid-binding protein
VKRILLDVNILLDVLLDRPPYAESASQLWAAVENGRAAGLIPAHGVTTIHYLIGRSKGKAFADRAVADLLSIFGVAAVDAAVLERAIGLGFRDFEDGVCAAAAETASCELLVTRDAAGFRKSPVPIVSPAVALAGLGPATPPRPARRSRSRES